MSTSARVDAHAPPDAPPDAPLAIVHRDDWLCAVHKPSGLLVHRTPLDRGATRFAVQLLRDQIGCRVHPVHRLDRGTSGVLLFALDRDVARALGAQFETGIVAKALPGGGARAPARGGHDRPPPRAAVRRLRAIATRRSRCRAAACGHPLPAPRHHRVAHAVDRYPTQPLCAARGLPETGRRHQIRRHLKHVAHPVIGDATTARAGTTASSRQLFGSDRLLLACVELRLRHPVTGAPLALHAPLAEDFARVAAALGWDPRFTGR